jgi:hypothetical protein
MGTFIHTAGDNRVKKKIQGKNKAQKQKFEKFNPRRLSAV